MDHNNDNDEHTVMTIGHMILWVTWHGTLILFYFLHFKMEFSYLCKTCMWLTNVLQIRNSTTFNNVSNNVYFSIDYNRNMLKYKTK